MRYLIGRKNFVFMISVEFLKEQQSAA